jgi:MraZ protein
MFLGQFTHSIDAKGRLTVPVKFRVLIAAGAYVTQGFDPNLLVYTAESFSRLAQRANALSTSDPAARTVRRLIFGGAVDVGLDSAGRILIPDFLRKHAGLEGDTTIVGAGEYFEIWSAAAWDKEHVLVSDSEANAKRFTAFDLSAG